MHVYICKNSFDFEIIKVKTVDFALKENNVAQRSLGTACYINNVVLLVSISNRELATEKVFYHLIILDVSSQLSLILIYT